MRTIVVYTLLELKILLSFKVSRQALWRSQPSCQEIRVSPSPGWGRGLTRPERLTQHLNLSSGDYQNGTVINLFPLYLHTACVVYLLLCFVCYFKCKRQINKPVICN